MASQLSKQVYDQRDSLQPVADAVGLKLRTATGVTREGLLPADKAGPARPPAVRTPRCWTTRACARRCSRPMCCAKSRIPA